MIFVEKTFTKDFETGGYIVVTIDAQIANKDEAKSGNDWLKCLKQSDYFNLITSQKPFNYQRADGNNKT